MRTRDKRARLGEINRAFNLAIKAENNLALYAEEDVWSPPLASLAIGAGDCEDYAIAKFVALGEAGVPAEDLRIVILRNSIRLEDHAVVAARLDGHWLLLDNLRMAMIEDMQLRNYRPLYVVDHRGVRQYIDTLPASAQAPKSSSSNSP
jgi:predicted transglutaminase-like cysteine proteinase